MLNKKCRVCGVEKSLDDFYYTKNNKDKRLNECKKCSVARMARNYAKRRDHYITYQRENYRGNELFQKRMRYDGIVSRCRGRKERRYSVCGTKPLTRDEYDKWWSDHRDEFLRLFKNWRKSNYQPKLAPSIDRINNKLGYIPSNMQWLTHSENSRKQKKNIYGI